MFNRLFPKIVEHRCQNVDSILQNLPYDVIDEERLVTVLLTIMGSGLHVDTADFVFDVDDRMKHYVSQKELNALEVEVEKSNVTQHEFREKTGRSASYQYGDLYGTKFIRTKYDIQDDLLHSYVSANHTLDNL